VSFATLIDVRRRRRLHEDAVDSGIGIELLHDSDEFGLRGGGREFVFHRMHAEFGAHLVLRPHIGARGGIVTHEHHRQPRRQAAGF
jgi:hypothetical protein